VSVEQTAPDAPAPEVVAEMPLSPKAEIAAPRLTPELRREYEQLFATCAIRNERLTATNAIVDKLLEARSRYAALETALGTPWYVPAVIHSLEAGFASNAISTTATR